MIIWEKKRWVEEQRCFFSCARSTIFILKNNLSCNWKSRLTETTLQQNTYCYECVSFQERWLSISKYGSHGKIWSEGLMFISLRKSNCVEYTRRGRHWYGVSVQAWSIKGCIQTTRRKDRDINGLFCKHSWRLIVKRLNLDWSFVAYGRSAEWVLLMAGKDT